MRISKYKDGDIFWAIHKREKQATGDLGIARKLSYGFDFNTVERILNKKPPFSVYSHNLTSVEDKLEPQTIADVIDLALEMKDEEWFLELCNMREVK